MLGYLLLLVLRVYWLTVDPLHSSTAVNYLAIVTCVASSVYLHRADQPCVPVKNGDQSYIYRRRDNRGISKFKVFLAKLCRCYGIWGIVVCDKLVIWGVICGWIINRKTIIISNSYAIPGRVRDLMYIKQ